MTAGANHQNVPTMCFVANKNIAANCKKYHGMDAQIIPENPEDFVYTPEVCNPQSAVVTFYVLFEKNSTPLPHIQLWESIIAGSYLPVIGRSRSSPVVHAVVMDFSQLSSTWPSARLVQVYDEN